MRSLVLLALTALAALPLSAHEHWRCPGRMVAIEAPRPVYRYENRERWEHRERRDWHRGYACEEGRFQVRHGFSAPPFGLGLDIRIR